MVNVDKSVIYLQGGLGNQLFQYVFYRVQKYRSNEAILDLGRLIYDQQHGSISIIDFLGVEANQFIISENNSLPIHVKDSLVAKCFRTFARKFNLRCFLSSFYDFDASTELSAIPTGMQHYIGYFQFVDAAIENKKHVEECLIKNFDIDLLKYCKKYKGKTGLHIRRGDFVSSSDSKHVCLNIEAIKSAITRSNTEVVVFSDDIEWCKHHLSHFSSLHFHNGTSAFDDFIALSQCSNYILSGSTFSWWAAFVFSSEATEILYPLNHDAQFLSKSSNDKVGWKYSEF